MNSFRDYPLFEKPYVRQTIAQSGGWRLMAGHQCHFFTNFLTGTECFKRELKIKRVFLNRSLILNGGFEPEFDCVNVYLRNICTGILINDSKANELKLIFYGRFKQTFNWSSVFTGVLNKQWAKPCLAPCSGITGKLYETQFLPISMEKNGRAAHSSKETSSKWLMCVHSWDAIKVWCISWVTHDTLKLVLALTHELHHSNPVRRTGSLLVPYNYICMYMIYHLYQIVNYLIFLLISKAK